jgi:Flp pilus assembly protein TadG
MKRICLRQLKARVGRRGVIAVLTAVVLTGLFAFVAFAVDTAQIVLTQTQMQNAVDAAALAASQEIIAAVEAAGEAQTETNLDANSIAIENAKEMAVQVALANGVFVDPDLDVAFGKRGFDAQSQTWPIQWGATPYNVVKVTARRTNQDLSAEDGQLKLNFGWAVGKSSVPLTTSATSFVESRDIVLVLDYSASMNDDSTIGSFSKLGQANVEANLDQMWNALVAADPKFNGSAKSKFTSTGFGLINSPVGTYHSSTNSDTVFNALGLGATDGSGNLLYPFPQVGKNSSGVQYGVPSASSSKSKWKAYIDYVKNHSNSSYKKKYGYRTLIDYLLVNKYRNSDSEDLWRTPMYPFHAMKEATTLFCDFLADLDFGDEVGLVNFATTARTETSINEDGYVADLGTDLLTNDYSAINSIQRHRQAGHYDSTTALGDGIKEGRELIVNNARFGARRTMLLITDGLANVRPSGWSLPSGFHWSDWTDWDGNGSADFSTTNKDRQYAFWEATQAIQAGITIHTVTVGIDADDELMEAIAKAAGGIWVDVPGGTTVAAMEEELLSAFSQIAAKVPPPKFVYSD